MPHGIFSVGLQWQLGTEPPVATLLGTEIVQF